MDQGVITHPLQGVANLAGILFTGLEERNVAREETAGRDALAKAVAGVDLDTGEATPEQLAVMMQRDPNVGLAFIKQAVEGRRARAEAAKTEADALRARGWSVEDANRQAAATVAAREDQQTFQAGQTAGTQAFQAGQQEDQQAASAAAASTAHERSVSETQRQEGRQNVVHITGDQAKEAGLNPNNTYEINPATGTVKDITPARTAQVRPLSTEEVTARPNLDPKKEYQIDETGKVSEVGGGGVNVQLVSPETGAKIGLIDEFLGNYDMVEAAAREGQMTGPVDMTMGVTMGRGEGGKAYRMLRQGTEGLVRIMTGAGMPESEARDRVRQYEPTWTDDAETLTSKVQGLKNAVLSARQGATFGRNAPPEPGSGNGPSDDDLVKKYGG